MNREETARHELSHLVGGLLAVRRDYRHLLHKLVGEVHVSDSGGHCCIYPSDAAIKENIEVPYQVKRLMALGPLTIRGIESLRGTLRSKQVPESGSAMSGADIRLAITHGGLDLTIKDCTLLTATAIVVAGDGFDTAALAVADTGTLALPLVKWLPEATCSKALAMCGKSFEALHSRFDDDPAWVKSSVDRRWSEVMA